jgi:hypothetical protein
VINPSLGTRIAATLTTLMLIACSDVYEMRIIDASAELDRGRAHYNVSVTINRRDADNILDGEIYAHLVAFDCGNEADRYPAEPEISNVPLSSFSLARRQLPGDRAGSVRIDGEVPKAVWDRYSRICVRMDGGSYAGRRLETNVVSVRVR